MPRYPIIPPKKLNFSLFLSFFCFNLYDYDSQFMKIQNPGFYEILFFFNYTKDNIQNYTFEIGSVKGFFGSNHCISVLYTKHFSSKTAEFSDSQLSSIT